MSGSIHAFDPEPSGKFIIVATQTVIVGASTVSRPTGSNHIRDKHERRDQRFFARAKRSGRVLGVKVRRKTWTLVNQVNDAHAFDTIEQAKQALKSVIADRARQQRFYLAIHMGHQITRMALTGYRVRVIGPELWPTPNPVEVIGALA